MEAVTGKTSLIGIFDSFEVDELPSETRPAWIFLQFADGIGRYNVTIEILDLEADEVVARSHSLDIDFPQRLATMDVTALLPPLPVDREGAFDLSCWPMVRKWIARSFK